MESNHVYIAFYFKIIIDEEYEEYGYSAQEVTVKMGESGATKLRTLVENFKKIMAEKLGIPTQCIQIISKDEYESSVEE